MLGVVAQQEGRSELAVDLIQRAIAILPTAPAFHSNLGEVYQRLGRLEAATAAFRRAIQIKPDYVKAHNNLGVALVKQGFPADAEAALRRALELRPDYVEAYKNLGIALRDQGRLEEAVAACVGALQLQPEYAEVHNILGVTLLEWGLPADAEASLRRALEIRPEYGEAHSNLGLAFRRQGRLEEAVGAFRRALEIKPDYAEVHNILGVALLEHGLLADAEAALRRALEIQPDYAEAHSNLGLALREQGRLEEAAAEFRRALEIEPDYSDAKGKLSILLLLQGDFERGLRMYEARREVLQTRRNFSEPMWNGQIVNGRRILIHTEQGFGDLIQFIRYAAIIAERGAEVVIECPRPLVELFRSANGVREVVVAGAPLPQFDLHVPMVSQPMVFETTLDSIPGAVPYLFADSARREAWAKRLYVNHARLRVGLAWAGNPLNPQSRMRNIPLKMLLPLLGVRGADFFSLQVGPGMEEIRMLPDPSLIIDHTKFIKDFADTAALMDELDLIISVDTAVAHLAGALARPVWTLLPFVPDWRWQLKREDSPWYPTMRLFRQPKSDDWTRVIQRVAEALTALVAQGG